MRPRLPLAGALAYRSREIELGHRGPQAREVALRLRLSLTGCSVLIVWPSDPAPPKPKGGDSSRTAPTLARFIRDRGSHVLRDVNATLLQVTYRY